MMMSRKSAGFDSKEEAWKYIKVHHRGSKLYLNRVDILQRQSFTMKRYKHSIKHLKAGSGKGCHLATTARLHQHTHSHQHTQAHTESDLLELKWMGINHKSLVNVAAY